MRTIILALSLLSVPLALAFDQPQALSQEDVTTVYLIRHAEKQLNAGRDPELTEQGRYRAEFWANLLKHIELDAVYSTDTTRTRDTARPIALSKDKTIEFYDALAIDYAGFVALNLNKSVLVVGHSNTIPAFVNHLLGKQQYQELDEANYSTLFIVDIVGDKRIAKALYIEAGKGSLNTDSKDADIELHPNEQQPLH